MRDFFQNYWRVLLLYLAIFLIATAFVLLCSFSTSPVYSSYYSYGGPPDGGDSLHFQTDGLSWLHGQVPYRDFFDHKGPLIFFFNMLGLWLGGGSRYGIVPLQILSLTIALIFIWKISQLVQKSHLWGWICIIVSLILMASPYNVGNFVQEYNFPFMVAAMYFMVKYFYDQKQGEHNPRWAFVYGISLGSCLLLQITDALPIGVGILVILVLLIMQRRWQNLGKNLLYGLAGLLVIYLPFVLYFAIQGAFGDFIYASIIFNLGYATKVGSWLSTMTGDSIMSFLVIFVAYFCGLGATILALVRKKWPYAIMLSICSLLETYLFLSGHMFGQYPFPFSFQIVLFLNELILFEHSDKIRNLVFIAMVTIISMFTYQQLLDRAAALVDVYRAIRATSYGQPDFEPLVNKYYEDIQATSFNTYVGGLETKGVYVRYNIIPSSRFPLIQSWLASFSDRTHDEILAELEDNRTEYLLTTKVSESDPLCDITSIIEKYYILIDRNGDYLMYKLKEKKQ